MFQITSKFGIGRGSHDHIAYLPEDEQGAPLRLESVTTEGGAKSKAHTHGLVYRTPQPVIDPVTMMPAVDPMTGQPVMEQFEPYWEVLPAEDGHTHELMGDVPRKPKKDKATDEEKVKRVRQLFKFAKNYEAKPRKAAKESEGFYDGSAQWDKNNADALEATGRAALKINLVAPAVDTLSGYQRQNRTDIKLLPVEEGDARVADIGTALIKNICEREDFEYAETEVFEDATITGRGLYHVYVDHDERLEGEIKIEQFAWQDVFFGPHEKKDLSDCEYLHITKWWNKDKIKQLWPDKADDITRDYESISEDDTHTRYEGEQYEKSDNELTPNADPDFVDTAAKDYRVIECEEILRRRVPVLVNPTDDVTMNADGWKGSHLSAVKKMGGWHIVYRPVNSLKVTIIAGTVLLEEHEREDAQFSIVPVYAKKRGKNWWGKVEPAKDAQREVNKRHSQAVDIVNKMGNYGYYIPPNTFNTPAELKYFKENASKPGFVVEVAQDGKVPIKEEGTKIPTEVLGLEENAVNRLREIMGVNQELMGQGGSQQSGIAMLERKKQGLLGNEFLFDNNALAKKLLGRLLVQKIQRVYTPERILRVLGKQNERAPIEIGGMPFEQQPQEELQKLLETEDLTKYDVVVGESSHSPTQQMAEFVLLLESARAGIPIPPELMLESAPLPQVKKEKALKSLAAQQQASAQAEKAKQDTELIKSLPDQVQVPQAMQRLQGPQAMGR